MIRRTFLEMAAALAAGAQLDTPAFGQRDSGQTRDDAQPRFSLAHLTVLGCPPPEATRIAARAGYDFVSYRMLPMGLPNEPEYDLARDAGLLRETRAALAVTGLKLHDIEVARIADGVDVKSYAPSLEVAGELGARRVITSVWTSDRQRALDTMGEFCALTAKSGLSVSLEFVSWANVATLRDAVDLCRRLRSPNLGLLIDVLHFSRSRTQPVELDTVPREWFHFAHISDAPAQIPGTRDGLIHEGREARLYPGEGAIDIAAIVNRMAATPYSLEIPNLERVRELGYAEHARRCLESAKKYFRAHPRG